MSKLADKATQAVRETASSFATLALENGAVYYTPTLERPSGFAKGLAVNFWGAQIEAIVEAGWTLEQWAVDDGVAYPVFQRSSEQPPT